MRASAAKTTIRIPDDIMGVGLMGYGITTNVVQGIETDLHVRTACFDDEQSGLFLFVHAEIGLMFPELKADLLQRLGDARVHDANLMLVAQHTHSGPGGYTHFPFYNFTLGGFKPKVFEAISDALLASVQKALAALRPAEIEQQRQEIAPEMPIGYNRSLRAYLRNPGAEALNADQTHLAFERAMDIWNVRDTASGRYMFQLNWFGVHPTSCGNNFNRICFDNKGFAAEMLERERGDGFVAIFAQQLTGDVSPNYHGPGQKLIRNTKKQLQNARENGTLQYEIARSSFLNRAPMPNGDGRIRSMLSEYNLAAMPVAAGFSNNEAGAASVPAAHGMAFIQGTPVDGPGIPVALGRMASRWFKPLDPADFQYPKVPVLESGTGKVAGTTDLNKFKMIGPFEKTIQGVLWHKKQGLLEKLPWTPAILPLQIVRIGHTVLIGFPGEITTTAGRILRQMCLDALKPAGVEKVLISTYANSYFGYCTTYHEYMEQAYEGGHTVFGRHTQGAFLTAYKQLIQDFISDER